MHEHAHTQTHTYQSVCVRVRACVSFTSPEQIRAVCCFNKCQQKQHHCERHPEAHARTPTPTLSEAIASQAEPGSVMRRTGRTIQQSNPSTGDSGSPEMGLLARWTHANTHASLNTQDTAHLDGNGPTARIHETKSNWFQRTADISITWHCSRRQQSQ